ncbi:PREDICTED: pleckstrin homology domain-containing family A member 6 isoform X9 [Thamnophis sirtalis]|uniref:Pleckstrin homology domain-containing family A member 6 isoform X9 n=1 Tax=Thamnophis sirtalis TaxID=35019 RepID=A0A6I9Z3R5_9SAUR|nr:PREDICTED: pleckstrin homology domain-containing family A member 6 isoform X9 [Thamnophis sirtalis]
MLKFRADRRVSHNERRNTFLPPVTGQTPEENNHFGLQRSVFDMSSKASSKRPAAVSSESSNHTEVPQERPNGRASSRTSRKGIAFGKRSNSMKRNPSAAVTKNGWLFKQASSGVKQWNKRWFVLVDRCLFYYKDEKEESVLGSIPLLSFRVAAVQPSDNISRKYTFKVTVCWMEERPQNHKKSFSPQAEHAGIRTYFFSAENNEEQESWIQAMGEAARVQIPPTQRHEKTDCENIPPSKNHHHHHQRSILTRELAKAELEAKTRGEGDGRGSEKIERKPERVANKKETLVKTNGIASQDTPSEPGSPYPEAARVPAGVERTTQPNGWQYSSPTRPGSMAFPQHDGDTVISRRSFAPRTNPEKIAQRKSSMTQLQQWVNLRRGVPPPEDLHSPNRFFPMSRRVPDYYPPYSSQYSEDYQYYPPGMRPDSICSMPAYERVSPQWAVEDKRHAFRNSSSFQLREWKEQPGYSRQDMPMWIPGPTRQPVYYDEMDAASGSLRRMSLQPRSRSVPRSPSQGSYNRTRVYSPVRSPSAHFERMPSRNEEIYAEPSTYMMRRSVSSPKYDYLGDRKPVSAGMFPFNYPASPTVHDKMMSESETLITMVNRMVESSSPRAQLYLQVSHFPEAYRETLHTYKINEQHTDKLLGKLCEQNKVIREQERLVQQLRAEKESLESALMGTHQELEMFGSQPAYPEKLLHKKESLQNQLINIRVELSQASTALANSTMEYDNLEAEVSALHDDLWEQLNLDIQNEMLNRQIQKEIWRIQDVMEGLKKNNPSRGTDTAKHRVALGPSGTYSSNSPASPLSSASLTSPLSPFSLVSGSQSSPTKQGSNESKSSFEQSKKDHHRASASHSTVEAGLLQSRQDQDADKQVALNKVGIVPPRTKSPMDDELSPTSGVVRRSANGRDSRDRPKSAVFSNEMKAKMSVEEQIDRMKRHQSSSMKEKRRSLQLPANQQQTDSPLSKAPASYKVVRRHRSIHEVDISDLEAALRSEDSGKMYESPRDEIARLRKMELEPEHYDVDISKELSTPDKVLIPERYIELEPDTPLSPEEMKEKQKKVERIKTLIAKSSMQNVIPLSEGEIELAQDSETQLQEQEKRIEISCALATEASRRGRMLSAQCATPSPPTSPASLTPPTKSLSSDSSQSTDSHFMRV